MAVAPPRLMGETLPITATWYTPTIRITTEGSKEQHAESLQTTRVRPLQWVSGSTWSCRCSSTHPPAFTFLTSSSAALLPVFSAGSPVPVLAHYHQPITLLK